MLNVYEIFIGFPFAEKVMHQNMWQRYKIEFLASYLIKKID